MFRAGVSVYATGVVATMYGVEIVQLQALNPCSQAATVQLLSTEKLPLMTKAIFDLWAPGDNSGIREMLYQNDQGETDIPVGWMALWKLLRSRSQDLFKVACIEENQQLLGWGTFGYVFKKEDNKVIKVSRFGQRAFLAREATAYREIGEHSGLLKCDGMGTFNVMLGEATVETPSLTLSPQCVKLMPHLITGSRADRKTKLLNICTTFKDTLDYIHVKGYTVIDVSAENMMFTEQGKPKLIDLSNAVKLGTIMKTFWGTPPFLHRQVHLLPQYWVAKKEIDLVGLTFVVAALQHSLNNGLHCCEIPWSEKFLDGRVKDKVVLEERKSQATAILRHLFETYPWMEVALTSDGDAGNGFCGCNQSSTCKTRKRKKAGEACHPDIVNVALTACGPRTQMDTTLKSQTKK